MVIKVTKIGHLVSANLNFNSIGDIVKSLNLICRHHRKNCDYFKEKLFIAS